jgi:putative phosphoribosyl transferase
MKEEIKMPVGNVTLYGNLTLPINAETLVIFSHGSGSSRMSPRNRYVAELLNEENMGSLLTDLLTEEEDNIYDNRFNIYLITSRLIAVTNYVRHLRKT